MNKPWGTCKLLDKQIQQIVRRLGTGWHSVDVPLRVTPYRRNISCFGCQRPPWSTNTMIRFRSICRMGSFCESGCWFLSWDWFSLTWIGVCWKIKALYAFARSKRWNITDNHAEVHVRLERRSNFPGFYQDQRERTRYPYLSCLVLSRYIRYPIIKLV